MKVHSSSPEVVHPRPTELALFATGDLPWRGRVRLRWHLRSCASCTGELNELRHAIADVQGGRVKEVTPAVPILDWAVLEREMLGNIGVGLAAARCIEKVKTHRGIVWRGSLLAAVLTVLFVLGWITHIPREQDEHLLNSMQQLFGGGHRGRVTVVKADMQHLSLGAGGGGLVLDHPPAANTSSRGDSEIDVRYLDDETGQVTILRLSAIQNYGPQ